MKLQLHSVRKYESNPVKRIAVNIALSAVTGFAGISGGCFFKDTNPPVIRDYTMGGFLAAGENKWGMENEEFIVTADTYDDRGVKDVYVQLNDDLVIPLGKAAGSPAGQRGALGENATWKGNYRIPRGTYDYVITAKDQDNQATEKGKLTIYPYDSDGDGISYRDEIKYGLDPNKPDPAAKYLVDKELGFLIPKLKNLNGNTVFDGKTKAAIDLIASYYAKIKGMFPGIVDDFMALLDVKELDEGYIGNVEKLLEMASDPVNKATFDMMLMTVKMEKKSICAAVNKYLSSSNSSDEIDKVISTSPYASYADTIKSVVGKNTLKGFTGDSKLSPIMDILKKIYPKYCGAQR